MELNQIIEGDCLTVLKTMPDKLVQCVVTSPPYWGLRDYGEVGQLGLESTPEEYVAKMVEIFAEVRRVLRDDGSLWLNLGDSYWGGKGQSSQAWSTANQDRDTIQGSQHQICGKGETRPSDGKHSTLKPKDLCGIPWRVAFALQTDGWYLRSDIIWSKPNPMPESVTDRPTKAHEYMFLLTKKARYYYDADAIREASIRPGETGDLGSQKGRDWDIPEGDPNYRGEKGSQWGKPITTGSNRNRRTVWEIATQPYPEAHFATFPEKLVEPCILAGSNDRACGVCGAAWEREIKVSGGVIGQSWHDHSNDMEDGAKASSELIATMKNGSYKRQTLGFRPTCKHDNGESRSVILDPFMGSGTVALVALKHGRDYLGIELKPDYIAMAMKRLKPLGNRPLPQQEKILI